MVEKTTRIARSGTKSTLVRTAEIPVVEIGLPAIATESRVVISNATMENLVIRVNLHQNIVV